MSKAFKPPLGLVCKQFDVVERGDDGWVSVSTPTLDRMSDRVIASGLQVEAYKRNPIVLWGHNYADPFAVIGRASAVEVTDSGMRLLPEWREPANDSDPMHIIASLWETRFINAFSIGFRPIRYEENDEGGLDYLESEILEVSLVPVPANQEALRAVQRMLHPVLGTRTTSTGEISEGQISEMQPLAWVRRLDVETNTGNHSALACFSGWTRDIPEDAMQLGCDEDGELIEVPHRDAGTTVNGLDCSYVPPIPFYSETWDNDDAVYATSGRAANDADLVQCSDWKVLELSDVLLVLPNEVGLPVERSIGLEVCTITKRGVTAARTLVQRRLGSTTKDDQIPKPEELDAPAQDDVALVWNAFAMFLTVALGTIAQQQGDLDE